jgi:DNA-binding beta-propeller fold protein YncE
MLYALMAACLVLPSCGLRNKNELRVERTFRVGAEPEFLALSDDEKTLAVACGRSNDVWVLDLKGAEAPKRIDTGAQPAGMLLDSRARRILVAESGSDTLAQISMEEGRVTRRFKVLPGPADLQPIPGHGGAAQERTLVTSLDVKGFGVFRGSSLRAEKTVLLEGFVERLLPSKDGKELLAVTRDTGAFVRVRMADLSPRWSLRVKGTPVDLALSADGKFAWVAGAGRYFDPTEEERAPEPGGLSLVRLKDSRLVDSSALCPGVKSLTLSHSGSFLYALCLEEDELQVFDSRTLELKARLEVHGSPCAAVLSADGARLYVAQRDLKQVLAVATGAWK